MCVVWCPCSLLLDNERWKQAEVPAEFQDLVNSIADGRITLPERKIPGTKNTMPPTDLTRNITTICSVDRKREQLHVMIVFNQ